MKGVLVCRFGSGVQELAERCKGENYCRMRCGNAADRYDSAVFNPEQIHICAEFFRQWEEEQKHAGEVNE